MNIKPASNNEILSRWRRAAAGGSLSKAITLDLLCHSFNVLDAKAPTKRETEAVVAAAIGISEKALRGMICEIAPDAIRRFMSLREKTPVKARKKRLQIVSIEASIAEKNLIGVLHSRPKLSFPEVAAVFDISLPELRTRIGLLFIRWANAFEKQADNVKKPGQESRGKQSR